MELTSRERLLRLFDGKDIDRIPIWLLAPYHPISCYADIYKEESYKKILPYIEKYCDTFDRRRYGGNFLCFNNNPELKRRHAEEDGVWTSFIEYKDLQFKKKVENTGGTSKIKYFIDDVEDLAKLAEIPYIAPSPDFSDYEKEKAALGDKGVMMMDLGDPLVPIYSLSSPEDFAIWSLTDYDLMLEFIDEMYKRAHALYKTYLDNNIGDVFFIVGAEFAGPPLVSPDKFSELCVRYVKGLVDLVRSYGKKTIVHYHGNLYHVLSGMREINADGLHTIEAPPIGDCTITQAREALGDMILIGNVQYDDMTRHSAQEIDTEVKAVIEEGKSGRFILSPSAGPYERNISEKLADNYIAFIEAGIKYGKL